MAWLIIGALLALFNLIAFTRLNFFGAECILIATSKTDFMQNGPTCLNGLYYILWSVAAAMLAGGIVSVLKSINDTNARQLASLHQNGALNQSYDRKKWDALVAVDSEVAAAAEQIKHLGRSAHAELAEKYLALNDKQYLSKIVGNILATHKPGARDIDIEKFAKNVELVWRTPWGAVAKLHDGKAVAHRSGTTRTYASLETFHEQEPTAKGGWEKVSNIEVQRDLFNTILTGM